MIEGIGTKPQLSRMQGRNKAATEPIGAESYAQGGFSLLKWWENHARNDDLPRLSDVDGIAIRVVHGEREFRTPRSDRFPCHCEDHRVRETRTFS